MDRFVNLELMANPLNWIMVALILALSAFALNLLFAPPPSAGMSG